MTVDQKLIEFLRGLQESDEIKIIGFSTDADLFRKQALLGSMVTCMKTGRYTLTIDFERPDEVAAFRTRTAL